MSQALECCGSMLSFATCSCQTRSNESLGPTLTLVSSHEFMYEAVASKERSRESSIVTN